MGSEATPGPWYITDRGDVVRIREEASDAVIATAEDGGHPEEEIFNYKQQLANALLIAAAPSLSVAAQHLLDMIEAQGRAHTPAPRRETDDEANSRDERDQVFADAVARLSSAIAKARGQSA